MTTEPQQQDSRWQTLLEEASNRKIQEEENKTIYKNDVLLLPKKGQVPPPHNFFNFQETTLRQREMILQYEIARLLGIINHQEAIIIEKTHQEKKLKEEISNLLREKEERVKNEAVKEFMLHQHILSLSEAREEEMKRMQKYEQNERERKEKEKEKKEIIERRQREHQEKEEKEHQEMTNRFFIFQDEYLRNKNDQYQEDMKKYSKAMAKYELEVASMKSRESKLNAIIEHDKGEGVPYILEKYKISRSTFFKWKRLFVINQLEDDPKPIPPKKPSPVNLRRLNILHAYYISNLPVNDILAKFEISRQSFYNLKLQWLTTNDIDYRTRNNDNSIHTLSEDHPDKPLKDALQLIDYKVDLNPIKTFLNENGIIRKRSRYSDLNE